MDKGLKKKWVAALRSGDFEQGRDELVQPGELGGQVYCCLGVLAKVAKLRLVREGTILRDRLSAGDDEDTTSQLSEAHCDAVGLPFGVMETLATKNDGGWSFERIATYIEKAKAW